MVRPGVSLDTNQAWRQLLEELQDRPTLQLTTDNHLASGINAVHLKTDLAMSRPIVVIVCMFGSSKLWGP